MFDRNSGIIDSKTEQPLLKSTRVAIAGLGGDGGELAIMLSRMGIGKFALADPEVFEIENINRQAGCYSSTVGQNKASVIAKIIMDINPDAQVKVYEEGVTSNNVAEFAKEADVIVDETEFTQHDIGVNIARQARKCGIPVFMGLNVGFGCIITSFSPNGLTFEEYLGLDQNLSLDEIKAQAVPLEKWVPKLPDYIDKSVVQAVAIGERPAPTVAPGVALCAGFLATEIFNFLTKKEKPIEAPASIWFDAVNRELKIINSN